AGAAGRRRAASQTHNGCARMCSENSRIMPRNFPKDCNVTHTDAWARSVRAAEVPRTVPVPSAASKRSVMPGPSGRRTTCKAIRAQLRKVVVASMAGTVVEWYEFFLYATAATLVFHVLFPPSDDPLTPILAGFATYAVGFIARPVGGIVFGHFGDKYGRKKLLQISIILVGVATFLMGCLPTYAAIGALAPILLVLLR